MKGKIKFIIILFCLNIIYSEDNNTIELSLEKVENNDTAKNLTEEGTNELDSTQEIDYVINITSLQHFDDIISKVTSNDTLLVEFYMTTCPHCIRFHPIYVKLANIFKESKELKFVRIESEFYEEVIKKYKTIKLEGFPTLFIYRNKEFVKFNGLMLYDDIYNYIDKIHFFKCNEIKDIDYLNDNFINDKILFSLERKKKYILGLFKNTTNTTLNQLYISKFTYLTSLNNIVVDKHNCYYYLYNDNSKFISLYLNNNDNYIYAYNNKNGINSFKYLDNYIKENENKNLFENKYEYFINTSYLKPFEHINAIKYSNIKERKMEKIICSYHKDLKNKCKNIFNHLLLYNENIIYSYSLLLFNIDKKINKEIYNPFRHYKYGVGSGLYFLSNDNRIEYTIINSTLLENYTLERIVNKTFKFIYKKEKGLVKFNKKVDEARELVKNTFIGLGNILIGILGGNSTNATKINETALLNNNTNKTVIKIIKKNDIVKENNKALRDNKDKEKEVPEESVLNSIDNETRSITKLITFPLYLVIYSILFYIFYIKVLRNCKKDILDIKLPSQENIKKM